MPPPRRWCCSWSRRPARNIRAASVSPRPCSRCSTATALTATACSETAGEINLLGTIDATEENIANAYQQLLPSTAYAALTQDERWVKIAQYCGETWYSEPKDYFAHGGTLAPLLMQGPRGGRARPGEPPAQSSTGSISTRRSTAPIPGTRTSGGSRIPNGEQALRAHIRQRFGDDLAAATVRGPGQRGVAGGKPDPRSAPGAGRRRLGPDRKRRVAKHRRAGVPEDAAACAGGHRAFTLPRHRRHLRPRRKVPVPQLLGPQGAGRTAKTHRRHAIDNSAFHRRAIRCSSSQATRARMCEEQVSDTVSRWRLPCWARFCTSARRWRPTIGPRDPRCTCR